MKSAILIAGFSISGAVSAFGQTAAQPADRNAPAAAAGGSMVFIDPATRKIRKPSPSEVGSHAAREKAAAAARPPTGRRVIQGPGGAVGMLMDDSDMTFMVATRRADGKIAVDCVTGRDAASRAAKPRAAKSPENQ